MTPAKRLLMTFQRSFDEHETAVCPYTSDIAREKYGRLRSRLKGREPYVRQIPRQDF